MPGVPFSPYVGAAPESDPIAELAETNPAEYQRYLRMPIDAREDYRDKHFEKKYPARSGLPRSTKRTNTIRNPARD